MHLPELISDLAIMLLTAGVVTVIFKKIKQPLVLGYIVAGFLIGPYMPFFFTVADSASISTWSEIGVIVLMFGLGLEFNLHKLAQVGGTAIITALTEVGGMLLIGFGVGQLLGWGIMDSVFLGGMLSMSSTTIIIKAFDELGVRTQGFAQLVFGTLVIEDIAGIFMMIILSTLSVSQSISGGALAMKFLPETVPAVVMIIVTVVMAIVFGMIYSTLLGLACINFKADQTIVGTAMNMLGTAAATVIVKAMNTAESPDNVSSTIQYINAKKAFLVNIGSFEFNWFMLLAVIALVCSFITLYRTRFGLRLMACGEHPQAADSVGINVYKMRWAGVLISGLLGGLGGIVYITAGVSEWKFENGVAGFGFLSLAVMIFGQWKPIRIALAALLFGMFRALSNVYTGFDFLTALNMPSTVYNMLPYIISLIVLAFTSKKSRAPKAEGIPYDKGSR